MVAPIDMRALGTAAPAAPTVLESGDIASQSQNVTPVGVGESTPAVDPRCAALIAPDPTPPLGLGLPKPGGTASLTPRAQSNPTASTSDNEALRSLRLRFGFPNDNWGWLVPAVLGRPDLAWMDGNDTGYTHGASLTATWRSGAWAHDAGFTTDLYSQRTGRDYLRDGRRVIEQDSVDLTALSFGAYWQTSPLLSTRFAGELGLRNLGLAMDLQTAWHSVVPAPLPGHRVLDPMSVFAGATVGERASLSSHGFGLSLEAGAHGNTYEGSSFLYAQAGASATLGPLSLSGRHELRWYGGERLAQETKLALGVDFGPLAFMAEGSLVSGDFNTPLTQYNNDRDVVVTLSLDIPLGKWLAGPRNR
jgi:hypothetical protein